VTTTVADGRVPRRPQPESRRTAPTPTPPQEWGRGLRVLVQAGTNGLPVLVELASDGTIEVADRRQGTTNRAITVKKQVQTSEPVDFGPEKSGR
jgi:hypothetical protein